MKDQQLKHHQVNFGTSTKIQISIVLDEMGSPANLGSIFRNAEAFGVQNIWIHNSNQKDLESTRFKRTSRSTWKNVSISFYEDCQKVIDDFDGQKIGLEITSTSKDITTLSEQKIDRVLLVVGNEKRGIAEDILQKLDHIFHIKMFGKNSSLNVSQSLGIALHEITREI
ncbi:TrmH family RNA methyltransferase [Psychroflexus sp. YR1-1]|uniref:TrmH family RNA methyltransferase n=1 Tax=Psychroflexus aurantiacus TaxID=2709310 RepID=A0A6B3R9X2_9FLAO|nr:TrmH family RNA methyltransferase [Psychroflexus aurantiacus]NEV94381.1 TrmH family RNA methyltransferase [Psychroflexus aurantiacus]